MLGLDRRVAAPGHGTMKPVAAEGEEGEAG